MHWRIAQSARGNMALWFYCNFFSKVRQIYKWKKHNLISDPFNLKTFPQIEKLGHRKRILLSLAGTEGIPNRFGKVKVSFWIMWNHLNVITVNVIGRICNHTSKVPFTKEVWIKIASYSSHLVNLIKKAWSHFDHI